MLTTRDCFVAVVFGLSLAAASVADELIIFPNAEQSAEQQESDKFTCYNWAKDESSFDPMAPPTVTEAPPQEGPRKGGTGRGLVRGAAVGQVVGGDSDSTAKGAAAGLLIGGMRRQDQKRKEAAERKQWEEEQARIYTENRNRYNRAYAACLEGKNYTVR
jgi:hypothetical protein